MSTRDPKKGNSFRELLRYNRGHWCRFRRRTRTCSGSASTAGPKPNKKQTIINPNASPQRTQLISLAPRDSFRCGDVTPEHAWCSGTSFPPQAPVVPAAGDY